MPMFRLVALVCLLNAVGCSAFDAPSKPEIQLVATADPAAAYIELTGLSRAEARALGQPTTTDVDYHRVMTVRVVRPDGARAPEPVAGTYTVHGRALRFRPLFPFDPGRQYEVTAFPAGQAHGEHRETLTATVALAAAPSPPPVFVTRVFPSADVLPENQLRMYIHFSGPMGRRGGLDHVALLDENGREVADPFLPLDAEFWNDDRTRYTLFFDPGRQKRGILPNRDMGPSLVEGRTYTLVIRRGWLDGNGQPLRETFTRRFRVGPPDLHALDQRRWQIAAPAEGTRDPLVVTFPRPLDHGLLRRALGVRRDGQPITGDVRIENDETRWLLVPRDSWQPGRYELLALSFLEDTAGNRIGRAFEIKTFAREPAGPEPEDIVIPFSLKSTAP
jgi:hypothetical protein